MSGCPQWYSLRKLAEAIQKPVEFLVEPAQRLGLLPPEGADGHVPRDDVSRLLAAAHPDLPRRRYFLDGSVLPFLDRPWAKALRSLYEEDTSWPASLSPQQGELLRSLILNLNPTTCLEIGCFIGASTLWICSALEDCGGDGVLLSVDLYGDKLPWPSVPYLFYPDALSSIRRRLHGASLAHRNVQMEGNSHRIGAQYEANVGKPLDFLFIDGDHTLEGAMMDFAFYEPHLRPGGILVLHDIFPEACNWDGPAAIIQHVLKPRPDVFQLVELSTQPSDYGMAIIRKLKSLPMRIHVDGNEVAR